MEKSEKSAEQATPVEASSSVARGAQQLGLRQDVVEIGSSRAGAGRHGDGDGVEHDVGHDGAHELRLREELRELVNAKVGTVDARVESVDARVGTIDRKLDLLLSRLVGDTGFGDGSRLGMGAKVAATAPGGSAVDVTTIGTDAQQMLSPAASAASTTRPVPTVPGVGGTSSEKRTITTHLFGGGGSVRTNTGPMAASFDHDGGASGHGSINQGLLPQPLVLGADLDSFLEEYEFAISNSGGRVSDALKVQQLLRLLPPAVSAAVKTYPAYKVGTYLGAVGALRDAYRPYMRRPTLLDFKRCSMRTPGGPTNAAMYADAFERLVRRADGAYGATFYRDMLVRGMTEELGRRLDDKYEGREVTYVEALDFLRQVGNKHGAWETARLNEGHYDEMFAPALEPVSAAGADAKARTAGGVAYQVVGGHAQPTVPPVNADAMDFLTRKFDELRVDVMQAVRSPGGGAANVSAAEAYGGGWAVDVCAQGDVPNWSRGGGPKGIDGRNGQRGGNYERGGYRGDDRGGYRASGYERVGHGYRRDMGCWFCLATTHRKRDCPELRRALSERLVYLDADGYVYVRQTDERLPHTEHGLKYELELRIGRLNEPTRGELRTTSAADQANMPMAAGNAAPNGAARGNGPGPGGAAPLVGNVNCIEVVDMKGFRTGVVSDGYSMHAEKTTYPHALPAKGSRVEVGGVEYVDVDGVKRTAGEALEQEGEVSRNDPAKKGRTDESAQQLADHVTVVPRIPVRASRTAPGRVRFARPPESIEIPISPPRFATSPANATMPQAGPADSTSAPVATVKGPAAAQKASAAGGEAKKTERVTNYGYETKVSDDFLAGVAELVDTARTGSTKDLLMNSIVRDGINSKYGTRQRVYKDAGPKTVKVSYLDVAGYDENNEPRWAEFEDENSECGDVASAQAQPAREDEGRVGPLCYMPVRIGGFEISAMVDGGSQVNVMDLSTARKLGLPFVDTDMHMRAANSSTDPFDFETAGRIAVRVGDHATYQTLFVRRTSSHPLILGRPFIYSTRMLEDNSQGPGKTILTLQTPGQRRVTVMAIPTERIRGMPLVVEMSQPNMNTNDSAYLREIGEPLNVSTGFVAIPPEAHNRVVDVGRIEIIPDKEVHDDVVQALMRDDEVEAFTGVTVLPKEEAIKHASGTTPVVEVNTIRKRVADKVRPANVPIPDGAAPASAERTDTHEPVMAKARLTPTTAKAIRLGENLTGAERAAFLDVLEKRQGALAFSDEQIGLLRPHIEMPVMIRTVPHEPWALRPMRFSQVEWQAVTEIIKDRLSKGVLEYSQGPYANRYFIVKKKNGKWRFIQDVRELNKHTIKDANIPPLVEDQLERLGGYPLLTLLDAMSGYDQIPLAVESRDLTAMWTPIGLVRMTRLPQGATNSVATFERIMSRALGATKGRIAENMVDDITVHAETRDRDETVGSDGCRRYVRAHIDAVDEVLARLEDAGLTVSVEKAQFGVDEAEVLGTVLHRWGRQLTQGRLDKIARWRRPERVRELRGFLALANICGAYVPHLGAVLEPLTRLTRGGRGGPRKSDDLIVWSNECERAFQLAKSMFLESGYLKTPDYGEDAPPFVVYTDAGDFAAGSALMQADENGGDLRPVRFDSKLFNEAQRKYSAPKREVLAILFACKRLRVYLHGRRFSLRTDSRTAIGMINKPTALPDATTTRWIAYISMYDISLEHVDRKDNLLADAMTRIEGYEPQLAGDVDDPMATDRRLDDEFDRGLRSTTLDARVVSVAGTEAEQQLDETHDVGDLGRDEGGEDTDFDLEAEREAGETAILERRYTKEHESVIRFLLWGTAPADGSSAERRAFRKRALRYLWWDGALWRRRSRRRPTLVVDDEERRLEILRDLHDDAGHRGRDGTFHKIAERYFWDNMWKDVRTYVESCRTCQVMSNTTPAYEYGALPIGTVMSAIQIDHVKMPKSRGKSYLLDAQCTVSGYAEAVAVPDVSAAHVVRFLENVVFATHGCVPTVIADGGTVSAKEVQQCVERHGGRLVTTQAYNPRGNSIVERGHGPLVRTLAKMGVQTGRAWPDLLRDALLVDRTTVRRTTGHTPFYMVFGRECVLASDLRHETWGAIVPELPIDTETLMEMRLQEMLTYRACVEEARARLDTERSKGRERRAANGAKSVTDIADGDLVLVRCNELDTTYDSRRKLSPRWRGPFLVIGRHGQTLELEQLDGAAMRQTVSIHRAKLFVQRANEKECRVDKGVSVVASE